jgi:hypothetical protein
MPMLLARRKPDHVSRVNFLDRTTLALRQPQPAMTIKFVLRDEYATPSERLARR